MNIVDAMSEQVKKVRLETEPAVCISGGIDSCALLHHVVNDLMDGDGKRVHTFVAKFGTKYDETDKARRIANYYETNHTEVEINRDKMMDLYHLALRDYPIPRFNLWEWFLVQSAYVKSLSDLFIGEGSDELFGYCDRGFLEGWAGHLEWVWPSWRGGCDHYDIKLHAPFREIQEGKSLPVTEFYEAPNKSRLRESYRGILPDFVIEQPKNPPSHAYYEMMGMTREEIQIEVCKIWLKVRHVI